MRIYGHARKGWKRGKGTFKLVNKLFYINDTEKPINYHWISNSQSIWRRKRKTNSRKLGKN